MLLHPIDLAIIVVYLVGCVVAGVWMRRYVRDVEDFAVAGREMDLNLGDRLAGGDRGGHRHRDVHGPERLRARFCRGDARRAGLLAMLLVGITGFVIVPLRNAGVMTIPELFEKRFGKRVRWLAGLVVDPRRAAQHGDLPPPGRRVPDARDRAGSRSRRSRSLGPC